MTHPTVMHMGPHTWNVEYHDFLTNNGETDADTLTIRLSALLPETLMRSTLLHELLHACCPTIDVPPKCDAEERFITAIEPALFAVLADPRNRELVAYITEGSPVR